MKRFFLPLLLLVTLSLYGSPYRVLFLSSYNPSFPTYHRQLEGIKSVFSTGELLLDEEYLDSKRLGFDSNLETFTARLEYKLSRLAPYDLVIGADDNALHYLQQYGETIFPGIPYVFLGINDIENGLSANENPLATGVLEEVSLKENMELIKRHFPDMGDLIVISDVTASGKADLNSFLQFIKDNPYFNVRVLSLEEYSFSELERNLDLIGEGIPILLLSAYTDREGTTMDFFESFRRIYSYARGPIYHLWEHGFGEGALGGFVVDHYSQGEAAGALAKRILSGESPGDIPVIAKSPNHYLMDYKEMRRWDIRRRDNPPDTIYLNDPRLDNRQLRRVIYLLIFFLTALSLVIFIIARLNRKLGAANLDLAGSRNRFENFFLNNPAVLLLIDPTDGAIRDINREGLRFYGYSRDEILSMTIYQINLLVPELVKSGMDRARENQRNYFQFKHKMKDGVIRDVEVFTRPIEIDGTGYLLSGVHDISEKIRMQRELFHREKMNALGFLAGGIAHDFNNLLTGIIGHCDLISMSADDEDQISHSLSMIMDSALTARDLTRKILTFSRQKEKVREEYFPGRIMEKCLEEKKISLPANILIDPRYDRELSLWGSGIEFQQIIQNIVTNAIHSMEEKGGILRVGLEIKKDPEDLRGDYFLIEVEDQGMGMGEETKKNIFNPYYTTKKMGTGTGLGLAIVRSIVDEEGGEIRVTSELGKGSRFRIYLPYIPFSSFSDKEGGQFVDKS